jgi:hypothetical protein
MARREQDRSCHGARTGPLGGRWTGHRGRAARRADLQSTVLFGQLKATFGSESDSCWQDVAGTERSASRARRGQPGHLLGPDGALRNRGLSTIHWYWERRAQRVASFVELVHCERCKRCRNHGRRTPLLSSLGLRSQSDAGDRRGSSRREHSRDSSHQIRMRYPMERSFATQVDWTARTTRGVRTSSHPRAESSGSPVSLHPPRSTSPFRSAFLHASHLDEQFFGRSLSVQSWSDGLRW